MAIRAATHLFPPLLSWFPSGCSLHQQGFFPPLRLVSPPPSMGPDFFRSTRAAELWLPPTFDHPSPLFPPPPTLSRAVLQTCPPPGWPVDRFFRNFLPDVMTTDTSLVSLSGRGSSFPPRDSGFRVLALVATIHVTFPLSCPSPCPRWLKTPTV